MLLIKDLTDLKKYLETRREMARGQINPKLKFPDAAAAYANGMGYAYEESIKAVEALMQYQSREEEPE